MNNIITELKVNFVLPTGAMGNIAGNTERQVKNTSYGNYLTSIFVSSVFYRWLHGKENGFAHWDALCWRERKRYHS